MDPTVALMLLLQAGAVADQSPVNPYAYPTTTAPVYNAARPDPYGAPLQNMLVAPWGAVVIEKPEAGRFMVIEGDSETRIGE